ncbi:transposase, partial [Parenemella sanctibonifatiensis]|uniref:transposase n=1 Tax=Parenemella sanctibonifatiensis TaxID=2016505 RepID=UPI0015C6699B
MPKPHPKEFRDDVVAVARRGEASIGQIAKDFGISESCLRNWLSKADRADAPAGDNRSAAELREAKKRIRL